MLRETLAADHAEIDISDLEVRYKASNEPVLLNFVDLARAIEEGLSFTVALANPEIVPSGQVVMTLIIVGANAVLAGSSGVFSKNPHAALVQDVVPIQGNNPATVTIHLLHDDRHFVDIRWHEGGGPYETTLSVAPVGDEDDARAGTGVNLAAPFEINSHMAHIDFHFYGRE
jgi:hypothetical protein